MTLQEIREIYGVPAFKGSKVEIISISLRTAVPATIIGSSRRYLKVKLEDGTIRLAHPTAGIKYL